MKLVKGVNDLATTHPELAKQWSSLNDISVTEVTHGSNIKRIWECSSGHTWDDTPNNRTSLQYGCPICSGKRVAKGVNDLATVNPTLACQVSPNSDILADSVTGKSKKSPIWRCTVDPRHEWRATVVDRSHGNGCPVCSGYKVMAGVNDLKTTHPLFERYWHPSNPSIEKFHAGSHSRVKWICENGHTTHSNVRNRVLRGKSCGVCSGRITVSGVNDILTLRPDLAEEWHPDNTRSVSDTSPNYNGKVKWACHKGHEWTVSPNQRTQSGTGCPTCSRNKFSSVGETELFKFVSTITNNTVIRNSRSVVKGHELDIYIPHLKCAVEFNGAYYHSDLFRNESYHEDKRIACMEVGIRLIQIWDYQWKCRREAIENKLRNILLESSKHNACLNVVNIRGEGVHSFVDNNSLYGKLLGNYTIGVYDSNILVSIIDASCNIKTINIHQILVSPSIGVKLDTVLRTVLVYAKIIGLSEVTSKLNLLTDQEDDYISAGFFVHKNIPPDYTYVYRDTVYDKSEFPIERFLNDPSLKYKNGLSEHDLVKLNNILRVWDAGSTVMRAILH